MGEFSNEILGLVPEVIAQHREEEAIRSEEEAARSREAEQRRLAELAADERYRMLGKEVVRLLQQNRVPTKPIYDRTRRRGPVHQVGNAWAVQFIYPEQPFDSERYIPSDEPYASRPMYALRDTGVIFRYRRTLYEGDGQYGDPKGKKYKGIVFPDEPLSGQQGLDMIEDEGFKRGIASLVATNNRSQ